MPELPEGIVTFLFTDVEGSTRLLERDRAAADAALARHHELLASAVAADGGVVFETVGDAVYAAFAEPADAASAALAAQRAMADEPWPIAVGELRIRIALHGGAVERRGRRYFGVPLFTAARLLGLAHGGQTLVSADFATALAGRLPAGASLRPLGRHRLKDLREPMVVHQLDGSGLAADFPPIRSLGVVHLPAQPTAFLGRERDVAAVRERLAVDGVRVLTLTGPGGTGKTRLAVEAAASLAERYPDGVWWVPLAPVSDPELVLPAIAAVVGTRGDLVAHLETWTALLVLDNLEQVVGCAPGLAELLAGCPSLVLLVTSRERLRIAAETTYEVAPLERGDAVGLLRARAAVVRPGLAIDDDIADAMCRSLDDLPLAVELAAARFGILEPADVLARLARRLDALGSGGRDAPDRHRTLRAAVAWSYDLLGAAERDLFERLGVFVGGWTMEAAESVCGADLDTLAALVDASLVRRDGGRFEMLEVIREYAVERLDARPDGEAIRIGHADWYAELAWRGESGMTMPGGRGTSYFTLLDGEAANLWAALAFALDHRLARAAHLLVANTWRFWEYRGLGPAALRIARTGPWDELPAPDDPLLNACGGINELERVFGDHELAIAGKEAELADPLVAGHPTLLAALHADLADLEAQAGRVALAREHAETALRIRRELGKPVGIAHACVALALAARAAGDMTAAAEAARECTRLAPIDEYPGVEFAMDAAETLRLAGDPSGAAGILGTALTAAIRLRLDIACATGLATVAALALEGDRQFLAVSLASASVAAVERAGGAYADPSERDRTLRKAREQLGADRFEVALDEGRSTALEVAVDEAVAWLAERQPSSRLRRA